MKLHESWPYPQVLQLLQKDGVIPEHGDCSSHYEEILNVLFDKHHPYWEQLENDY